MSAKKSWDIAPKARPAAAAAKPRAAQREASRPMRDMRPRPTAPAKPSVPVSKKNVTISRGTKKVRAEPREPLKKRRKKTQKALVVVCAVFLALILALLIYLAWLPALRVSSVSATGPHSAEVELLARQTLYGTHALVLPRNSLFFVPEDDIRARILSAHPDVEAVSIAADGLTSIRVTTLARAEAFLWCGAARAAAEELCYSANAEGLVFAMATPDVASTSEALRLYAPLEGHDGPTPVNARIGYASRIPEALRFVKAMQTLGADVISLSFRDDEADLHTAAGTRITYVLGREEEAAGIAASVFPQLELNDGSVQYVDLRFSGKAYFKRAASGSSDGGAETTEEEPLLAE